MKRTLFIIAVLALLSSFALGDDLLQYIAGVASQAGRERSEMKAEIAVLQSSMEEIQWLGRAVAAVVIGIVVKYAVDKFRTKE